MFDGNSLDLILRVRVAGEQIARHGFGQGFGRRSSRERLLPNLPRPLKPENLGQMSRQAPGEQCKRQARLAAIEECILRANAEVLLLPPISQTAARAYDLWNQAITPFVAAQQPVNDIKDRLSTAIAHKNQIAIDIALFRGAMHPIRRVPTEVLVHIFLLWDSKCSAAGRHNEAPFTASAVCSMWRSAALSSSNLWAKLRVPLPLATRDMLDAVLNRSRYRPLDITF